MSDKWGKCLTKNLGILLAQLVIVLATTAFLPSSSQAAPPRQVLVIPRPATPPGDPPDLISAYRGRVRFLFLEDRNSETGAEFRIEV